MGTPYQIAATLILNELLPRLKKCGMEESPIPPSVLMGMAYAKHEGVLDTYTIRRMMDAVFDPSC